MPLESERSIIGVGDPDQLQPNFTIQSSVLGSIAELLRNIDILAEPMGSREKALQILSGKTGIPYSSILEILSIPYTVNFSMHMNPLSGEPIDPSEFLPDPSADTATEAIDYTFNAGLKQVLEEVMHS